MEKKLHNFFNTLKAVVHLHKPQVHQSHLKKTTGMSVVDISLDQDIDLEGFYKQHTIWR